MKKLLLYAIIISFSFSVIGCGKSSEPETASAPVEVSAEVADPTAEPTEKPTPAPTKEPEEEKVVKFDNYDKFKQAIEDGLPGTEVSRNDKGLIVELSAEGSDEKVYQSVIDNNYSSSYLMIWDKLLESRAKNSSDISGVAKKFGYTGQTLFAINGKTGYYAVFVDGKLYQEVFEDKER